MGVVSIPKRNDNLDVPADTSRQNPSDLVDILAAGSLVAGGVLLFTRRRRTGMVLAAAGAALTFLNQEDTVRTWWANIPAYIDQVERIVGQVQSTVDEFAVRRDSLHRALGRIRTEA